MREREGEREREREKERRVQKEIENPFPLVRNEERKNVTCIFFTF
jgi:hypothetical protein